MKRVPIRLGPLALLLTVVTICMTVLGILTFATARADLAMAEKLAASTRERYELEAEGQAFLRQAAEGAKEVGCVHITRETGCVGFGIYEFPPEAVAELGVEEIDGIYWKELRHGSETLKIGLKLFDESWDAADLMYDIDDAFTVVCWQFSGDWQPPQEIGGLWLGG